MRIKDFQSDTSKQLNQILYTLRSLHKVDLNLESRSLASLQRISESSIKIKNKIITESRFNTYNSNPEYAKHMLIIEAVKIFLKEIAPKRRRRNTLNEDISGTIQPNQPQQPGNSQTNNNTPPGSTTSNTSNATVNGNNITVQRNGQTKVINSNQLSNMRNQGYEVVGDVNESRIKMTPELAALMKRYGITPNGIEENKIKRDMKMKKIKRINENTLSYRKTPELMALMKRYGVSTDGEVDEANAFDRAAASARVQNKKTFEFPKGSNTKYPEKMGLSTAKKIVDEENDLVPHSGIKMTPELLSLMKRYNVKPNSKSLVLDRLAENKVRMTPELVALMKRYGIAPKGNVNESDVDASNIDYDKLTKEHLIAAKAARDSNDAEDLQKHVDLSNYYRIKSGEEPSKRIIDKDRFCKYVEKKYATDIKLNESKISKKRNNLKESKSIQDYLTLAKKCDDNARIASERGPGRDMGDEESKQKWEDLADYYRLMAGEKPSRPIKDNARFLVQMEKIFNLKEGKNISNIVSKKKSIRETTDFDDHHASIARSELYRNTKYAMDMFKMIKPGFQVDGWISANLASAAETLDQIYHHLDYTEKYEPESLPEDMDLDVGEEGPIDESPDIDDFSVDRENLMLIVEYSTKLFNLIQPGDKIEGWIAMKLTTSSEKISSAKHYLEYKQFEMHAGDMIPEPVITKASIKENIGTLLMKMMVTEDQDLEHAQTLLACKALSDEFQSIAEKVAKMSVEDLMPLVDTMKSQFGLEQAEGYNAVMKSNFDAVLSAASVAKDGSDNAILQLQSGGIPGQSTDIENSDDRSTDDLNDDTYDDTEDDGLNSTPPASGKPSNPVGREKKEAQISENWNNKMNPNSKDKGKWKDYTIAELKAKKKKLMDKETRSASEQKEVKELNFAIRAKQNDKWGSIKEANTFIKENRNRFVSKYGEQKGESVLYAMAWKKFSNKPAEYVRAKSLLESNRIKLEKLNSNFESHKVKHKRDIREGRIIDSTNTGYGLEGEVILNKIAEVKSSNKKALSTLKKHINNGAKKLAERQRINKKITTIKEAKNTAPYGVTWKTKSGRTQRKFFETADLRSLWINLKKKTILSENFEYINPIDFDNELNRLLNKRI